MKRRKKFKGVDKCVHNYVYDHSVSSGDWFVCTLCGSREFRDYRYS